MSHNESGLGGGSGLVSLCGLGLPFWHHLYRDGLGPMPGEGLVGGVGVRDRAALQKEGLSREVLQAQLPV